MAIRCFKGISIYSRKKEEGFHVFGLWIDIIDKSITAMKPAKIAYPETYIFLSGGSKMKKDYLIPTIGFVTIEEEKDVIRCSLSYNKISTDDLDSIDWDYIGI